MYILKQLLEKAFLLTVTTIYYLQRLQYLPCISLFHLALPNDSYAVVVYTCNVT